MRLGLPRRPAAASAPPDPAPLDPAPLGFQASSLCLLPLAFAPAAASAWKALPLAFVSSFHPSALSQASFSQGR